ncbi:stage VI sporulation protein F [Microaerobacter geothermalis]|uniref:stage VI sporulation protein F n=1 Tax=Microaerobacter geothermalis TaxID=674972 RepID=UPI001F487D5D|nr:stage VI sporulation protein F [Microaerobacter geothermalis]MCF6093530.1 stage VI sporulation protein F [Microaerobacter geothermalis]
MSNRFSKDMFDKLKKKTRNLDEHALKKLANGVTPGDLNDEDKAKELVRKLSKAVNVPLSKGKEEKILKYLKDHPITPSDVSKVKKMWNDKG